MSSGVNEVDAAREAVGNLGAEAAGVDPNIQNKTGLQKQDIQDVVLRLQGGETIAWAPAIVIGVPDVGTPIT